MAMSLSAPIGSPQIHRVRVCRVYQNAEGSLGLHAARSRRLDAGAIIDQKQGISDRLRQADRRAFARAELRRKIPSCRRIWMPFEPCRSRREPFANRQRRRAPAEFRTIDFGNEQATKKTRQNVDDFDQTR